MIKTLIAANWKMYKNISETKSFLETWKGKTFPAEREVAFFPSYTLLSDARTLLPEGQFLGAQNCNEEHEGACTGEVSCGQIIDVGCSFVLIGHSERRHLYGEGDGRISSKFHIAIEHGLRPVLCVGETLAQRESGNTLRVVTDQMEAVFSMKQPDSGFDIAYEPVWAIGTGKVAQPEDAAEVHSAIRKWLNERNSGVDSRILYGGSVKPENAGKLLSVSEVSGVLVGGASLDPESFYGILTAGV